MSIPAWAKILVALLLLFIGIIAISHFVCHQPTDEEQIRTLFDEAARAIKKKQIGDAVLGVSERFQGSGLDKRGIKRLLTYQVLRGRWVWVTIARTTIELQGNTARAIVDVVMSRSGKGIPLKELLPERATVYRIDFQLAREESDWKVTAAQWAPISLEDAIDGPASGIEASD